MILTSYPSFTTSVSGQSGSFVWNSIDNASPTGSFGFGDYTANYDLIPSEGEVPGIQLIEIKTNGIYTFDISTRLVVNNQNTDIFYKLNVYETPDIGAGPIFSEQIDRGQGRTGNVTDSFWGTYLFNYDASRYVLVEGGNDSNGEIRWNSGSFLEITQEG